jgi:hypothetical protein
VKKDRGQLPPVQFFLIQQPTLAGSQHFANPAKFLNTNPE